MSAWPWRLGGVLLALLLVGYAYVPVIAVGPAGGEFRTLVEIEEIVRPAAEVGLEDRVQHLFDVHGTEGRPLSALSLAISSLLWTPGAGNLVPLRLENLGLLALAAACTSVFVRRLFVPWLGSEQATAAGRASALLVLVQPLNIAAVATVGARGDLMALWLSTAAAALFLKSRQDRKHLLTVLAAVLAVLAGLSSRLALGLPFVVALAEFASSRRYRPAHVRWRTALTTLLVFAACVAFDLLVWNVQSGFSAGPAALGAPLASRLAMSLERLGALLLPVNAAGVGVLGFGVAGALLLLALQPALVAARSAPRLWGWMLLGWASITVVAELFAPAVRVRPEDFTRAATLLSATTAACVGLGVAATALSGLRRSLFPIALAVGWAVLAHHNAVAWSESAESATHLRRDLLAARETWGHEPPILVVDPPGRVAGIDAVRGALPWMLDPLFGGAPADTAPPELRAISSGGLRALAREPEFAELRRAPLIVVFPLKGLWGVSSPGGERESTRLDPYVPTAGKRSWFKEGDSRRLDLEMLGIGALEVTGADGADTSRAPAVSWRSNHLRLPRLHEAVLEGVWTSLDDPPTAIFDLSSSLAWLLGGRVQQVWSARGWIRMREAVLLEALPTPGVDFVPRREGADWFFDAPHGVFDPSAGAEWWVGLLDLDSWDWVELRGEETPGGSLHVRGAAAHVAGRLRAGPGPVAWTLEQRRDGLAVQRIRGRRVGH